MQTVTAPFQLYVTQLKDGKLLYLVYNYQNYTMYWLLFFALAAAGYYFVARSLFSSAMTHGLKVGFSSIASQVAGLFTVVIAFYVVFFFFSPADKLMVWILELTLLLVWFFYFLFSYFTAPESR